MLDVRQMDDIFTWLPDLPFTFYILPSCNMYPITMNQMQGQIQVAAEVS